MATINQIYQIVNDSANAAIGASAITAIDTGTFVSLGDQILNSTTNKEGFYNALVDRIGRTVIAIRNYEPRERAVKRDEMEWGLVYQKISYKLKDATTNPSWETAQQENPFDLEVSTEAVQKLFSKMGTWSYEDSIPDYQLFTAFTNPNAMGAFIAGIYTNIANSMALAEEDTANLAVDTYMAGALIKGTPSQKRNLLEEYNAASGEAAITTAQALKNPDFLKFASREINLVTKKMTKMSTMYNAESIPRHTPKDRMVVEVLAEFSTATASYLESDTYHDELVRLPNYEEVAYWQGVGTTNGFDDVSKINITNAELITESNATGTIEQSGIIAFVHDYDAVASIIYRRRSHSIYNPRSERYNIFEKADKGYAVDLSENGVVFYLAEPAVEAASLRTASKK